MQGHDSEDSHSMKASVLSHVCGSVWASWTHTEWAGGHHLASVELALDVLAR